MNKPGTSTNTSVGTSTSAGYTDDNPKDDSSKATANAATATNNSGQPNIVMNVTNITINVSPNSSNLGMDNIVCYFDSHIFASALVMKKGSAFLKTLMRFKHMSD